MTFYDSIDVRRDVFEMSSNIQSLVINPFPISKLEKIRKKLIASEECAKALKAAKEADEFLEETETNRDSVDYLHNLQHHWKAVYEHYLELLRFFAE